MARPKKTVFPGWFDPLYRPNFKYTPPKKMMEVGTTVSRDRIWEDANIEFDPAYKYHIEIEYDYCGGYADRSAEVYLIKHTLTEEENPKYESELRKYKKAQKEMDDRGKQWDELKPLWDKQELEKERRRDLQKLKELKAKYEKI